MALLLGWAKEAAAGSGLQKLPASREEWAGGGYREIQDLAGSDRAVLLSPASLVVFRVGPCS